MKIFEVKPVDLPVVVEVDAYVPISVRTFSAPLGCVYLRVGNFDSSLVEMPIDPSTGLVRGVKLVCFDRLCLKDPVSCQRFIEGLPSVGIESIPTRRVDEPRVVSVGLFGTKFVMDWSDGLAVSDVSRHGRLGFLIGAEGLLGAFIDPMTDLEMAVLKKHMTSITQL